MALRATTKMGEAVRHFGAGDFIIASLDTVWQFVKPSGFDIDLLRALRGLAWRA